MNVLGETLAVRQPDQSRCGENPENGSHIIFVINTEPGLNNLFLFSGENEQLRCDIILVLPEFKEINIMQSSDLL